MSLATGSPAGDAGATRPSDAGPRRAAPEARAAEAATPATADAADSADAEGVFAAPGPDGLSTFDLGSVPASVTPPSSWRKAAWFASLSSGAVVVALLVAGTLLVGPTDTNETADGWPDRNGAVAPLIPESSSDRGGRTGDATSDAPGSTAGSPERTETSSVERDSSAPEADPLHNGGPDRQSAGPAGSAPVDSAAPSEGPGTGTGESTGDAPNPGAGSGSPSSSPSPTKPPPSPAPTSTADQVYLGSSHDADAMAENSQTFLDQVTEDPPAAYELTSGALREEGPEGLEQSYSDIAFFEVTHIYVDQNEGYTSNTVRVTYEDGSTGEETRRLTFDDNEKISADGT